MDQQQDQEKKSEDPITKIRNEMRNNNWHQRNTKDYKKRWITICQQSGQPGWNDKFLETYNLPKVNQEEIRESE